MPAIARRLSNRDRPPRACERCSGNQGSTYFHTSSGTSANFASIPSRDHAALRPATFQQVRGGALSWRGPPFGSYPMRPNFLPEIGGFKSYAVAPRDKTLGSATSKVHKVTREAFAVPAALQQSSYE